MTDALLSPVVNAILRNLNSLALQEFGIAWGLKTQLDDLKSTLSTIQAVLQDAEAKQWKSEAVKDWLRKLKDAAYDADNVVDKFATEALKRRLDSERGARYQVSAFFSLRNRLIFRLKMGHKMKDIRERLDAIAGERSKFHLQQGIMETEVREVERRQTSSLVNEPEICGRNDENEMIIENLLNNLSDHDGVSVYAICGMGGLGKTTLAQLVYNDGRVEGHFELRIWVCVSDDFDVGRLTRAILESVQGGGCNMSNLDPLLRRLQEKLSGRKFLLVLDDVWNEYHEKWDRLKDALRCGAKGSAVIVTTRIQKIALSMATPTLPVHHLAHLSKDHSWSLFERHAFGIGQREENPQIDRIGKAIVKKCKGLPLAIKAIGCLMRFKSSVNEWLAVKESEIWDLSDNGDVSAILPSLRLSYNNLPPHSRQCFAYCCIFPKDFPMERDTLIEMWMANGFIPSRGQTTLHDMGHEIFNDLVLRSFLQDVKENFNGDTLCKMHDLMHDLAQSIMGNECSMMDPHKELKIPEKVRYLSFNTGLKWKVPWNEVVLEVPSVRSLVLLSHKYNCRDNFSPCISKQKYLRLLHLSSSVVEKLPKSISNFYHLRYLNMSYSSIKALPEWVNGLQNLQTLKLQGCEKLCKLPKSMKHMSNLTYLDIEGCCSLTSMPAKMGQLTRLRRLSTFIVGQDDGYQIGELKNLNLGGTLRIAKLHNVRNSAEAKSANLKRKQDLISLDLSWEGSNKENLPKNVEEVLESLQPNSNLKKLRIIYYRGSKFPNWMFDLVVLINLVEICLLYCRRCEHLPPLGKLPSLKILEISGVDSVKYLDQECYGDGENSFPALETLRLYLMPSLEEWRTTVLPLDGGGEIIIFPCLRKLSIHGCPKLTKLPFVPTLERLRILDSNAILFRSVNKLMLPSLSSLDIEDSEWKIVPDGLFQNYPDAVPNHQQLVDDSLSALKRLSIECCYKLENLPEGLLKNLNSLERLQMLRCDSLTSLPLQGMQGLTSLISLSIYSCKKLMFLSEGMQYLTALQSLSIEGCPEIQSFPEGMQHLNALRDLYIRDCEGLFSLPNWLGSLQSLSSLWICKCPNLRSLPDGLLQGHKTLKWLRIKECPHLERRCKKESGEDWPKIAHIPSIWINDEEVQCLDC